MDRQLASEFFFKACIFNEKFSFFLTPSWRNFQECTYLNFWWNHICAVLVNRSYHLRERHSEAYDPKIGKYQQNLRNSQYFYLILLQENGLFPPRKGVNSPIKRGNFHQENGLGTMHINKFFDCVLNENLEYLITKNVNLNSIMFVKPTMYLVCTKYHIR